MTIPFMKAFVPAGNFILLASGGASLVYRLRRDRSVEPAFVGIAVGMLGMTFYSQAFDHILGLSRLLENEVKQFGDPESLKTIVWQSMQAAANEPGPDGEKYAINIPAVIEQIFRTGVWGTLSLIGDFFYLLAGFFVEIRRDVLGALAQLLFPLLCGLYPIAPILAQSTFVYLIEMALWGPCLQLIQIIVGLLSKQYLNQAHSLGVPIIALEIIATLMILDIPRTVHQLLRGTLHPAGENAALGMIFVGARALKAEQAASFNKGKKQ